MKTQPTTKKWLKVSAVVLIVTVIAYLSGYISWYVIPIGLIPLARALYLLSCDHEVKPGW